MVGLREVARRHLFYVAAVSVVIMFSDNWAVCAPLLCVMSYALHYHSTHSLVFMMFVGVAFSMIEVVMIGLQVRTTRYEYAIPQLGIPLWLVPWWSVRAHWILDIYCVCGILQKRGLEKDEGCVV